MTQNIIVPSLTNDMILSLFRYLVDAELRKRIPGSLDFRFGCQEGLIATISLMFGDADELVAELSYDKEETWLQVTERIVDEKLSSWANSFEQLEDDHNVSIDFAQMVKDINGAVNEFALENPTLLIDALQKNL